MGRLTDKQRKKIIADYLETQSINFTAKKNGISWKTAKIVIGQDEEITKKLEEKKEQNTADILQYMESKRQEVCNIIDIGLSVLPSKIETAKSASEVTTAIGTLIDKFTMMNRQGQEVEDLSALADKLKL